MKAIVPLVWNSEAGLSRMSTFWGHLCVIDRALGVINLSPRERN